MRKQKRISIAMLLLMLLCSSFITIPVYAATQDTNPDIQVIGIKTNKKALKAGKKLTVQLEFRTNIDLRKVRVEYVGSGLNTYIAKLKAVNTEKTKWKGTLRIKKSMKKGKLGLSRIYITGKNDIQKKVQCVIRNNKWAVENFGMAYSIDQNLSGGNVKIIS